MPPGSPEQSLGKKDIERNRDLKQLNLLLEASAESYDSVAELTREAKINLKIQKRTLRCIWFRRMNDRRIDIGAPHRRTLEWALKADSGQAWDSLREWLMTGSGIYWVSGKAGSGKSTLMKFLHSHPDTMRCLSSWAGERCNVGDFFFTYRGGPEQNTQQGLSRALLYLILDACPGLIKDALPRCGRR